MEQQSDSNTNCNWCAHHKRIDTETRGLENKKMGGDHPNYSIIKIGQNTEKSTDGYEETCCHSIEKPSANAGVKTLKSVKQ